MSNLNNSQTVSASVSNQTVQTQEVAMSNPNAKVYEIEIFENDNNQKFVRINGGGRLIKGYYAVRGAINAWQDLALGQYNCPEPGLHLCANAQNGGIVEVAGYVGPMYEGTRMDAPVEWCPISNFGGFYNVNCYGTGKNALEHRRNANAKHAMIEWFVSGEGATLSLGDQMERYLNAAIEKVAKGPEGTKVRSKAIASQIHNRGVWKRATHIQDEQIVSESLVVSTKGGATEIDLFKLPDGTALDIFNKSGRELNPQFWLPENVANVKWWMQFSTTGGSVQVAQ
jgi:hypothetical protein